MKSNKTIRLGFFPPENFIFISERSFWRVLNLTIEELYLFVVHDFAGKLQNTHMYTKFTPIFNGRNSSIKSRQNCAAQFHNQAMFLLMRSLIEFKAIIFFIASKKLSTLSAFFPSFFLMKSNKTVRLGFFFLQKTSFLYLKKVFDGFWIRLSKNNNYVRCDFFYLAIFGYRKSKNKVFF